MNVLGIETSSEVCSVGFANDEGVRIERNLIDPHIHSEKLLTLITDVMSQAHESLQDLDVVAVSIGPGSFTGLRIGLSTAKGLCYAVGSQLVAIPTFAGVAVAANDLNYAKQNLLIVVDAKQGEFYVGAFDRGDSRGMLSIKVETRTIEYLEEKSLPILNSLWITDRPEVIQSLGVRKELIASYPSFCRGDSVARLGIERLRVHDVADLASLEPMYLKDFVVKTAIT